MLMGLTDLVLKKPRTVILLFVLVTLGLGFGIRFMKTDTDVTRDLPQNLPAKALYDRIDELFPGKEMVIVGIEDDALLSIDGVAKIDRLTKRLEAIAEVQSVMSPSNARIIEADGSGGMVVREAAAPLPTTAEQLAKYRADLFAQPMFVGSIINQQGTAAVVLVMIKAGVRDADVAETIMKMAKDPTASEGFTLHVTGRPAATYWSKVIMGRDMGMLSSAALLVVIFLLMLTFRSARGVLLPVAVVVCSVLWVLGLMGYAGFPITHSTEVMPILLVAIGVADGIHIMKGYYAAARGKNDAVQVVRDTMADLNRPVLLTSITTMAGFLALGTSGIESILMLGALTAFGVAVACVFSLMFIPAALVLMKVPKKSTDETKGAQFVWFENVAESYGRFLVRRKGLVAVSVVAVVVASAIGATQVPVEFSNLSNFAADHPFLKATLAVNRNFASTTNILVVVEGGAPDSIKDPVVLKKMDALEQWLLKQEHVGSVRSITGFIKQMNKVLHDDKAEQYRLPNTTEMETSTELVEENGVEVEKPVSFEVSGKEMVAQYLTLYEMSGKPGDFDTMVTPDFSTARMTVFVDSDRASVLTDLHEKVQAYLDKNFGETKAELTGMAELMRAVNNLVVEGQAWSIASSILLVFIITGLIFRSFSMGLFSTLPLFFCLFLNFGFMGMSGIALNIMTMATSSIAVGVGVDYAIHFVHRYQHDRLQGLSYEDAVLSTLRQSGVSIFINALTVGLGFMALYFSEFRGVAHMGLLISLTMLTSAFAALTIIPVLIVLLKPKAFVGPASSK